MKSLDFGRYVLSSCVAAAMLAGCGGSQPPIGAPDATLQRRLLPFFDDRSDNRNGEFQLLYKFKDYANGERPLAALVAENGVLYGTTSTGGIAKKGFAGGAGTLFSVTTSGVHKILHKFSGPPDGNYPLADLTYYKGALFSTTWFGGYTGNYLCADSGCGTVYSVTTSGREKVLYAFKGLPKGDGNYPIGTLAQVKGTFYGVTRGGGENGCSDGCGTAFSITPSGAYKIIHVFQPNGTDGEYPYGGLTYLKGTLYGTTMSGGTDGGGTVFLMSTSGRERVIYNFGGSGVDGNEPYESLAVLKGALYGATIAGGGGACRGSNGCGVIFSVTTSGKGKVVYAFPGRTVAYPSSVIAVHGVLYGTTAGAAGSTSDCQPYCGTIFSLTTSGNEKTLYTFKGESSSYTAQTGLIDLNGTFYGTTLRGGDDKQKYGGDGTVFAFTRKT
jgi:uncharacterized repeat protein (TIGR03803 family)